MPWAFAFVVLANATWFVARASYAQDTHPWIYRLLGGIALVCLAAGTATAVDIQAVPHSVKNVTASAVVVVVTGAMVWLTLRGNRFNGWQLLGTVPISFAALHCIAYNVGWLQHVELAQLMGMLSSALGLLMLLASLVWRSRGGVLSSGRAQAFADYDAETGLLAAEKRKSRLPRLLPRGSTLKSGSGVMLLRWVDAARYAGLAASAQRGQILRQVGILMRGTARDIDSLIRHDEDHFLMLVEGPISRDSLAAMASQIMAASLRGTDPALSAGASVPVHLHIAIWQETAATTSASNVMALLTRRLNIMSHNTPRRVQFIDSAVNDEPAESKRERDRRKHTVLDKIKEIEGEPTRIDSLR